MPEEVFEGPQSTEPTVSKSSGWPKIILAAVLGFGLLVGAAYAGYWYGTESAKVKIQSAKPTTVSQPTPTSKPLFEPTPTPVPDPTANWKTYTNDKNSFSFKFPDYFKYVLENPDGNGVYLAPSEGTGEGRGSPFGLDLTKDFWLSASATKLDNAGLKYWQDKLSNSNIIVDGIGGYKDQFLPKEATEPAYGYEALILKDGVLYKLGLAAGNKELVFLPEREKVFDQILSTFKFLD